MADPQAKLLIPIPTQPPPSVHLTPPHPPPQTPHPSPLHLHKQVLNSVPLDFRGTGMLSLHLPAPPFLMTTKQVTAGPSSITPDSAPHLAVTLTDPQLTAIPCLLLPPDGNPVFSCLLVPQWHWLLQGDRVTGSSQSWPGPVTGSPYSYSYPQLPCAPLGKGGGGDSTLSPQFEPAS